MALNIPVAMQGILLKSSDADLFQIIESVITVAAKRCPQEFLVRRDQIAQLLFSPPTTFTAFDPFFGKSDSTTVCSCVSQHMPENQVPADNTKDSNGSDADAKKRRHIIKINLSVLKKQRESKKPDQVLVQESTTTTGMDASRNVQDAKKPQVVLVQESTTTTGIDAARKVTDAKKPQVLVQETITKTGTDVARKVQEPVGKGQREGRCRPDLDEDVLFQQKLEATQKKLQERYQQYQDAKTKKRTRVIEWHDVPKPPADTKKPKFFHYRHH